MWVVIPRYGYVCHPGVIGHALGCLSSQYPQVVPDADNIHWEFGFGMLYSRCWAVHLVSGDWTVSLRGPGSQSDIAGSAATGGGGSRVERQRLRQCQDPSTSFMSKPERQALTSVLKGTAGELALLHSITCGGSEGCWIDHEVPCTKDPPALKGFPFFFWWEEEGCGGP